MNTHCVTMRLLCIHFFYPFYNFYLISSSMGIWAFSNVNASLLSVCMITIRLLSKTRGSGRQAGTHSSFQGLLKGTPRTFPKPTRRGLDPALVSAKEAWLRSCSRTARCPVGGLM